MNSNQYIFALTILLLITQSIIAQDSIKIESLLSIETIGQHNLATLNENFDCINCITGRVEDNPIHHLGLYTGINHTLILNEKYSLETGLFLEERSHSGGNNTLANLVLFPKIVITVKDSISKNGAVKYLLRGGDLWNEDIGDMLRIYNIDYQGLITKLIIKNFAFGFMTIGDLSRNIGLDLHQLYKFTTEYRTTNFRNEVSITINELFAPPRGRHPASLDFNIGNYSKLHLSTNSSIEGQLEMRLNRSLSPSFAGGIRFIHSKNRFSLTSSLRYYAEHFNLGYDGIKPRYFSPDGSYIGPQLYPLKNFYRNLSQWALYTHSENSDLLAFEITSNGTKNIYQKLFGFYELDCNYLYDLNNRRGYLYPIYNLGVQVDFLPFFNGRISVTNKHMELRNFYQTASISRAPFLSLGVNLKLEKVGLKTMYIKL